MSNDGIDIHVGGDLSTGDFNVGGVQIKTTVSGTGNSVSVDRDHDLRRLLQELNAQAQELPPAERAEVREDLKRIEELAASTPPDAPAAHRELGRLFHRVTEVFRGAAIYTQPLAQLATLIGVGSRWVG